MTVEARITSVWKKQKLLLAILLIGFGAWFAFDGAIGYPQSNKRWLAHESVKNDPGKWKELAAQNNWSEKVPEHFFEPRKTLEQFVAASICGTLGLVTLLYLLSQRGRTLRMDDETVTTATGVHVPFPAIIGVGKKQWDAKGIAKVRYTLDGKQGEFIVDDYKFDTKPTREILEEIEKRLLAKTV